MSPKIKVLGKEDGSGYKASHLIKNNIKRAIDISYSKYSKQRDKKDFATVQ